MPFYEYECSNCKFYTEVMQKISDTPLTKCPSCGKSALVKLVSAPNFRLKGGGWYETDFKGDKENKRNLAGADREESAAVADAPSKSETKSESKPEASSSDAKPAAAGSVSTSSVSKGGTNRSSGGSAKPATKAPAGKAKVAAKRGKAAPSKSKAKPAAKKKARR
jgi:putative FmdB family regulatory protein